MKTNYEHQRTTEGREAITRIARYASRGMMRTKQKSTHYAKILDACKRDLQLYGYENDQKETAHKRGREVSPYVRT